MPKAGKAWSGRWGRGAACPLGVPRAVRRGNPAWPGPASGGDLSSFSCPYPHPNHSRSVRGAGTRAGHGLSPINQLWPVPGCPHPWPAKCSAHPLSSSIMDSTLSASCATCRVSRKPVLAPPLPKPLPGAGPSVSRPGCPSGPPVPSCLQFVVESLGCHFPGMTMPLFRGLLRLTVGQRQKRVLKRGAGFTQPFACPRHQWGSYEATWMWGHVLIVLYPWVAEEGHP